MPSELEFLTKLTFHGMPRRAWNSESMNELINDLGGELVSMFVPPDSWALTVMAWMKKPSTIPKVIGVEIPVQEPGLYYSSPPRPPRTTLGMYLYRVFVHVEEVVNPSIEVLPPLLVLGSVDFPRVARNDGWHRAYSIARRRPLLLWEKRQGWLPGCALI